LKSKIPRRHHVNPQVLLREFADTDERVLVVPKWGKPSRVQDIRNVSVVKDANTLETVSGKDISLELALSRIESHYPAIVASLDRAPRSGEENALILSLVTTQFARDPYYRAWIGEEVALIYEALAFALRDDDQHITADEVEAELEHYAKGNIVKPHVNHEYRNVAIAGTAFLILMAYEDFASCNLTILRAPVGSFITGDSPIFLYDRYELAERRESLAISAGFLPETEITVPITSRHAALLTTASTKDLVDVGKDVVSIVNARTVRSSARDVYCPPNYSPELLSIDMSQWWWRRPILTTL
jgi:hypothetical protein